MTARLKNEIPDLIRVVGLEVSDAAVIKARSMFPEIEFRAGTISSVGDERFDMVVSKDVCGTCLTIYRAIYRRYTTTVRNGYILDKPFQKHTHFMERMYSRMQLAY